MKLETFFEKFDQLADTPDGVARMRALVLRLAMQGKLSEANDFDIPVSVLLCAIHDEKVGLGITSSGKRSREDFESLAEEASNAIPASWTWVRFGDIARHNAGKTLDKGRNSGELRDYITTSNLYWGYFRLEEVRQMPIQDDELERCTAKKGDLLICEGGEAGRAAVWPHDYEISFQNHIHRARFYGGVNPYFVQRFFETLNATGEIEKFRKGVGISNMSGKALASIVLPLPPLAEQKRIVAKVDELMVLCDRLATQQRERETRHAALARASLARFADAPTPANLNFIFHKSYDIASADLRKSILTLAVQGKLVPQDPNDEPAEALNSKIPKQLQAIAKKVGARFSAPAALVEAGDDLPPGWGTAAIQGVGITQTGTTPSKSESSFTGRDIPFIKPGDIHGDVIDYDNEGLSADGLSAGRLIPEHSVLMVSIGGSIGKAAIVNRDVSCNQQINSVTPAESVDPRFILAAIRSGNFQNEVMNRAAQGTLPIISKGKWETIRLPIPPLAEQRRIVAKVEQLMAFVEALETQLAASRAIATNLLSALVAELTVKG